MKKIANLRVFLGEIDNKEKGKQKEWESFEGSQRWES